VDNKFVSKNEETFRTKHLDGTPKNQGARQVSRSPPL